MNFEITENPELDAKLMVIAKQTHGMEDEVGEYTKAVEALGLTRELALMRGLWYIHVATPEYRAKVKVELKKLDPDYCDKAKRRIKESVVDGRLATIVSLPELDSDTLDLKDIGLDHTPEMKEFIDQIAESVVEKTPLAKPFIDAGAVRETVKEIAPGIQAHGIQFHRTKFAEMMKNPGKFAN